MIWIKCRKCGQLIPKKNTDKEILGYRSDPDLCYSCNVTRACVRATEDKKELTREDLAKLPRQIIFDPFNDDPREARIGLKFRENVESVAKQV